MIVNLTNASEHEVHKFVSFASDIGLRAGQWPEKLETTLGNKQPFVRVRKKLDTEGDLQYVVYEQALGCCSLRVYND